MIIHFTDVGGSVLGSLGAIKIQFGGFYEEYMRGCGFSVFV